MLSRNVIAAFGLALILVVGFFWLVGNNESSSDPETANSIIRVADSNIVAQSSSADSNPISAEVRKSMDNSVRKTLIAAELASRGLIDEAIAELEDAITLHSDNENALMQLMVLLDERGLQKVQEGETIGGYQDLIKAGSFARRVIDRDVVTQMSDQQRAWIGNALYNEACGHCFFGDRESGIEALRLAVSNGFDKLDLISDDPDLEILRNSPVYAKILKETLIQK